MKTINGKIVLVDNLKYEKELLKIALLQKHWDVAVEYFADAEIALEYLKRTEDKVFMVISAMSLPGMSGLDFKKAIDQDIIISKKSIPFIFASSTTSKEQVDEAYEYRVQGYFKKPSTINAQADMLDIIIHYWILSIHPNNDGETLSESYAHKAWRYIHGC